MIISSLRKINNLRTSWSPVCNTKFSINNTKPIHFPINHKKAKSKKTSYQKPKRGTAGVHEITLLENLGNSCFWVGVQLHMHYE